MADRVVAVILNWNCADDTLRCLRAVLDGSQVPDVIVVDNGSVDDSIDRLESAPEPFTLVKLDRNLGYAGGMNAGLRKAQSIGTTWVWLLNADAVPRPHALAALLSRADRFAVSASLQTTSAEPTDTQVEPYVVAAMLPKGKVRPFHCGGCDAGVHEVDMVTGASLLLRLSQVAAIGFFDERFFHYKEEFDLVRRLSDTGGRVGFVCASEVWHKRGGSLSGASPRARYYHHRNEILYIRKHYARPVRRIMLGEPIHYKNLARSLLRIGVGGREQRRAALAVLVGYWDGIRGVHGPTDRF
ncbi:glycosyltransferase family 2 protein [Micromonospora gifhornensis]|uniref:Glycosyltransferase 2-like domain-containing protein n=1 Tax=Micromonospora gifhornensis TaxID=84594 RepID=A0ABQ4IGN3_9ACTN|nr:glycosyltransferase family 2 protein [Micromonospora gifhornensis]GIJ16985.1 hypothetical protein Vgi01_36690 [Micromonospora gifhornensis]